MQSAYERKKKTIHRTNIINFTSWRFLTMRKIFNRFKHASAMLVIIALIIVLSSPVKSLAADYTVLNVDLNELDFSNPLLISGTEGAVNAIYLYDHVIIKDGIDVDAVIKIVSKSDTSASLALNPFDSEGPGQNPKRFEPIINSPATGGSFTFEVSFWENNTFQTEDPVSVYLKGFTLTGVDIDGGLEYQSISGYAYYLKDSSSRLTITQSGEYTKFSAISSNLDGVQFDNTAAYIAYYDLPIRKLTIILGNTGQATGTNRQYSLNFGNVIGAFTNPVNVQNPSKPTLTVQIIDSGGVLDSRYTDLTNVIITGSTDAGIGQTVLISVTDETNIVTGSAVVQVDGTYSTVMNFSSFTPGTVTATANVVSAGGTPADAATDTSIIVRYYTVSFEENGGSDVADQIVNYNDMAIRPSDPTRSGYDFDGWYTNADLSIAYSFSAAVKSDLTLYAKWTSSNTSPVASDDTATVTDDSSDNTINVLDNDTDADSDTLTSDLAVAIQSSAMKVVEGHTVIMSVTYANKTTISANNVTVNADIPSSMSIMSIENGGVISGNSIIWSLGALTGGETGRLTFELLVNDIINAQEYFTVTASIASSSANLINLEDDTSFIKLLVYSTDYEYEHKRYIKGFPDGGAYPESNITRAEVAAIFARILDLENTVKHQTIYSDVPSEFWAADYIEALTAQGIFNGYKDGTFKPNQTITRAELATVIARYLGIAREKNLNHYICMSGFTDTEGNWAAQTIEELFRYCVITGYEDGTFKPDKSVARAEAITMINRMLYRGPLTDVEPSFPDNDTTAWYFGDIEEATRTHYFKINSDGTEVLTRNVTESLW